MKFDQNFSFVRFSLRDEIFLFIKDFSNYLFRKVKKYSVFIRQVNFKNRYFSIIYNKRIHYARLIRLFARLNNF